MCSAFESVARQSKSLEQTEHRPWPAPKSMWLLGQSWLDLLFAHWPVPRAQLEPHVPAPLELETFQGQSWITISPFVVEALRLAATPPIPAVSRFPELNVRTYVTCQGKPGIWFLSLDAGSRAAVYGARRFFRLPYFNARMEVARATDGSIQYESWRGDGRGRPARFSAVYSPSGKPSAAALGSIDHFLTERYCLYSRSSTGSLYRADIHHRPWQLQPAEAEITTNTMPPPELQLEAERPLLHFATRQDVVVWKPTRISPQP
jgi:uncharacterized protein YqjF (DUF2071 family)